MPHHPVDERLYGYFGRFRAEQFARPDGSTFWRVTDAERSAHPVEAATLPEAMRLAHGPPVDCPACGGAGFVKAAVDVIDATRGGRWQTTETRPCACTIGR